jgi:integrase
MARAIAWTHYDTLKAQGLSDREIARRFAIPWTSFYRERQRHTAAHPSIPITQPTRAHRGTHSLRKTSAAKMMALTKRIDVVRDWLGHRSSSTTDTYLKSDNRERLAYVQVIGEQLFKHVA